MLIPRHRVVDLRSGAQAKVEGIRFVGRIGSPPNCAPFLPVLHEFTALNRLHLEMDHEMFRLFDMLSGGFLPSIQQLFVDWNGEYGVWEDARDTVLEAFRDARLVLKPKLVTPRQCKTIEHLQIQLGNKPTSLHDEDLIWLLSSLDFIPEAGNFDFVKNMKDGEAVLTGAETVMKELEGTDGIGPPDRRLAYRMKKIKKFYVEEAHLRITAIAYIVRPNCLLWRITDVFNRPITRTLESRNSKNSSIK